MGTELERLTQAHTHLCAALNILDEDGWDLAAERTETALVSLIGWAGANGIILPGWDTPIPELHGKKVNDA
jgi:hypothetical protein